MKIHLFLWKTFRDSGRMYRLGTDIKKTPIRDTFSQESNQEDDIRHKKKGFIRRCFHEYHVH